MISVHVDPGTYVVAVSGGVDSMVLLDLMHQLRDVRVIVAHVNHGMRPDAAEDATLVRNVSMSHNIVYEEISLHLGAEVSEETARDARYDFLRRVVKKYAATALVTAHHKDDVRETALINMMRGTGWRGLASLRSTAEIRRPLLDLTKAELVQYAAKHHILWRHDSTNDDQRYLRNYVRHAVIPKMSAQQLVKLDQYIVRQKLLTSEIDDEALQWCRTFLTVASSGAVLPRYPFIMMPPHVAHELIQTVLRQVSGKSVPRPLAENMLLFIKVAKAHKTFPFSVAWQLRSLPRKIIVERRPSMIS